MSSNKQSQQLTVKIYYQENGVNKEIRKFSLDDEMVTNYEYLMGKIKVYFTGLLRKDLELFWKDGDDDLILMSSDEELLELLKTVPCDAECLKLYIKEKSSVTPDPVGDVHPGIICDSCDQNIVGLRYICTVCPNFDLCAMCEKKGTHPIDHDMLCIKKPRVASSFQPFVSINSSINGGPWASFTSHQSGRPDFSNEKENNEEKSSSTKPNPPFTPPFHPQPPFHPPPPFRPPHFNPPFNPQFGHFSASFGVNPSATGGCAASAAQSLFTHPQTTSTSTTSSSSSSSSTTTPSSHMGGHFAQHMAHNFASNPGVAHMADHIAQSVGQNFANNPEFVSQLLNSTFSGTTPPQHGSNPMETSSVPATSPEQLARNMAQSFATNPEFISGVMRNFFNGCSTQQYQQQMYQQQHHQQQQQQQQQQSSEVHMSDGHCQEKEKGVAVNDDGSTTQKDQSSGPVVSPTDADVDDDNHPNAHLKYDPVAKNYVSVDKEAKTKELSEEEAYERKLDEAIRHMESMGFDNDKGWLKQLLISKDLDIGRVVDALKPPQP